MVTSLPDLPFSCAPAPLKNAFPGRNTYLLVCLSGSGYCRLPPVDHLTCMKTFAVCANLLLCSTPLCAEFDEHTWFLGDDTPSARTGIRFGLTDNQPRNFSGVRFPLKLNENNMMVSDGSKES